MTINRNVTPILVLGSARNGTTWLSNILACHPEIAGTHHRVHWGTDESEIYRSSKFAGDLRDDHRFIQFLEAYACSDYFRLARGAKEEFYRNRPASFEEFFLQLMDRFAEKEGVTYWTTKLDPMYYVDIEALQGFLSRLEERYGAYKLVAIKREFPAVLRSYLNRQGLRPIYGLSSWKKRSAIVVESARYALDYHEIGNLINARHGLYFDYEDFKKNHDRCLAQLAEYLGLDFLSADSRNAYPANSSFRHMASSAFPTASAWVAARLLQPAFSDAPGVARAVLRLREAMRGAPCPFEWRLHRLEHMPDSLAEELRRTGQAGLHELLFGSGDEGAEEGGRN